MGLTKQHFKAIAEIVNKNTIDETDGYEHNTNTKDLITDLSNYFKTQNSLFDEDKFKEACLK